MSLVSTQSVTISPVSMLPLTLFLSTYDSAAEIVNKFKRSPALHLHLDDPTALSQSEQTRLAWMLAPLRADGHLGALTLGVEPPTRIADPLRALATATAPCICSLVNLAGDVIEDVARDRSDDTPGGQLVRSIARLLTGDEFQSALSGDPSAGYTSHDLYELTNALDALDWMEPAPVHLSRLQSAVLALLAFHESEDLHVIAEALRIGAEGIEACVLVDDCGSLLVIDRDGEGVIIEGAQG